MESREEESVLKKIRIAALDAGIIIPPGGSCREFSVMTAKAMMLPGREFALDLLSM